VQNSIATLLLQTGRPLLNNQGEDDLGDQQGGRLADVILRCIVRSIYTATDSCEVSSKILSTTLDTNIKKENFKQKQAKTGLWKHQEGGEVAMSKEPKILVYLTFQNKV